MRTLPPVVGLGFVSLLAAGVGCGPPPPCTPGTPGCVDDKECHADKACASGYTCIDDECVEDGVACPPGELGCDCDDGGCGAGLVCGLDLVCEPAPECSPGTEGCACLPGEACGAAEDGSLMLCNRTEMLCEAAAMPTDGPGQPLGVPSPACFTPCTESLVQPDGSFRYCSSEGLMEGCLGQNTCVDGTCVGDGEFPAGCSAGIECPGHQTCISGFCLSNCTVDSDCGGGATCASMVCRTSCTTNADSCGSGYACQSTDGTDGWCVPQPTTSVLPPEGGYEPMVLSTQWVSFTNNRVSGQVLITNPSGRAESVTVRKVEHTEVTDGGREKVTENPLHWITLSATDITGTVLVAPTTVAEIEIEILPGETVALNLGDAFNSVLDRWEGLVHVAGARLGEADVFLEYATRPDGQWAGTSFYFLDFPTGTNAGDVAIEAWVAAMQGTSASAKVNAARLTGNALLLLWTEFRTNPLFTLDQVMAGLQSAKTGSWAYGAVHDACRDLFVGTTDAECYPYADPDAMSDDGLRIFTDSATLRVPTGVIEMPFVMRLTQDQSAGQPHTFVGRLETPEALHYPGLPPATLRFAADPALCESASAEACMARVETFSATSLVGGRYRASSGTGCDVMGFAANEVPWLLSDFKEGTVLSADGVPVRTECREARFPFDTGSNSDAAKNGSLAGANPLPDGRVRRRNIELLDGVMVNQDTMLLFVRETFDANLVSPSGESTNDADFAAYSFLELTKNGSDLSQEEAPYEPGVLPDEMSFDEPVGKIQNACEAGLVQELIGEDTVVGNEVAMVSRILTGLEDTLSPPAAVTALDNPGLGQLHYLCHATGRVDGGAGVFQTPEACPPGSGVTYFFYTGPGDLAAHTCNGTQANRCGCLYDSAGDCIEVDCDPGDVGTCADLLADAAEGDPNFVLDVPFQCDTWDGTMTGYTGAPDPNRIACHDDRFDLRVGKLFYDPTQTLGAVDSPLETQIADAFRYKTRFVSRTGGSIGFVPAVCVSDPSILPYCYDPEAIERVRARVSCLVDIFASGALDPIGDAASYDALQAFLTGAFSFYQDSAFGPARDGFERLYSELTIMLGDDALTKAVASRFDLAGSQVAAFRGDLLEPDGIVLSGGAGFEMVLLYRAHQYYQLVLDRFFQLSPSLWQGLQLDQEAKNFISLDSISTYFNRVILASTKKARASSEIARRYQAFNRADLARHVIERAYAEAYLESVSIGQFMRRSVTVLSANEVDALRYELSQAQLKYRQAMRQMREAYQAITDEVTFFGDPPDYVPFPAAGKFDIAAPRQMIERAQEALLVAKEREQRALSSNREFDVDAAQFQSELARIKQQYENDLADVCGTFVGTNGSVYPAIRRYADLHPIATLFGDPCGLMGNGVLWDQRAEVEGRSLEVRAEIADIRAVFGRVAIEQDRVDEECAGRVAIADVAFRIGNQRVTLRERMNAAEVQISSWEKKLSELDRKAQVAGAWAQVADSVVQGFQACQGLNPGPCVAAAVATVAGVAGHTTSAVFQTVAFTTQVSANSDIRVQEGIINDAEEDLDRLQRDQEYLSQIGECCLDALATGTDPTPNVCTMPGPLMVNSQAQVDNHLIDLLRTELEAARADLELQRALGRLEGLRNQVERTMALWEETEQHLINVEAARNDPNIRIYANADVLDADYTFYRALTAAFRATRMVEYYTATSYAAKEELFLVRMAGSGENNLENYVLELETAFNEFEQQFGSPSLRVHVLSLMDDIFQIPRVNEQGQALAASARTALLRERLTDPALLDDRGYVRIPFATSVNLTSPITSIHKVTYLEAELQGSDLGDRVGRVYLTAKGTATIRDLNGNLFFSRMDPVTAVINPYFNGVRLFDPDVYQEQRLRDRPFANTLWELGLNFKDEQVNEDINVNSITDVRLYLFYEDFTQL